MVGKNIIINKLKFKHIINNVGTMGTNWGRTINFQTNTKQCKSLVQFSLVRLNGNVNTNMPRVYTDRCPIRESQD